MDENKAPEELCQEEAASAEPAEETVSLEDNDSAGERSAEPELPTVKNTDGATHPVDDRPTEMFSPSAEQDAIDPLADAQSLPTLFPQQETAQPTEPELPSEPPKPTVVRRIRKKHWSIRILLVLWRVVRRVVASAIKWVLAIVLAAAILVGGLIGYLTVTEYNPDYAEKAMVGSKQIATPYQASTPLRIVTFNTGYGGLGADTDFFMDGGETVTPESEEYVKNSMFGIEQTLKYLDADIIFLQEVDTDSKRSYGLNQWLQYEFDLQEYESRFALNYSCNYVPYPFGTDMIGKVHSGIATYSRYDIASATRYSLPCPFNWPTRVANLKRCLLVTRIKIEGLKDNTDQEKVPELVLINVHFDAYDNGEGRAAQLQQLMELMQKEYDAGNYVIVGGDFNQTFPDCDTYPIINDEHFKPGLLPQLSGDWQYQYDDTYPTSRLLNEPYDPNSEATQYYVIDGFIVSPNVKVNKVFTHNGNFVYSDHNPVVMDIELK